MRVLLTTFAHRTHFQGSVPLAWALLAAGHEVRVASQPALTGAVVGAGLTAVPLGADHRLFDITPHDAERVHRHTNDLDFTRRADLDTWDFLLGMEEATARSVYPVVNNDSFVAELVDFARAWQPDLVLWEPFTFAGAIAARACGATHGRLLWGTDLNGLFRGRFLAERDRRPSDDRPDPLGTWIAGVADRFGVLFDPDLTVGQFSVDQLPAWFRPDTGLTTVPMRYVPYNGSAVVPDWLRTSGRDVRRICLTGGFSGLGLGADGVELAAALPVLSAFDGEVVVTGSDAGDRPLPGNVRVVDFVPLHALLESCVAVVHHGGAGTWSTALHHGVPQVSVAFEWDCLLRSQQVEQRGAGIHLHPGQIDPGALDGALRTVLEDPAYAAGARELRAEARDGPSPDEVVPVLTELTRQFADR